MYRLGNLGKGLGLSGVRRGVLDPYLFSGASIPFVADMGASPAVFRKDGQEAGFTDVFTHTRAGNATMGDSEGKIVWAPHNLASHSENADGWAKYGVTTSGNVLTETATSGFHLGAQNSIAAPQVTHVYYFRCSRPWALFASRAGDPVRIWVDLTSPAVGTTSAGISDAEIVSVGDGVFRASFIVTGQTGASHSVQFGPATGDNVTSYLGDGVSTFELIRHYQYRSDLGGMAKVPLARRVHPDLEYYVPTTTTAVYLPREEHHVYEGGEWVKAGCLVEPGATNLLLNSGALSTQSVTVTAVAHTLSFAGTGTVTLSGASTAGPLVGAGTGENNRARLTFTPSAGTLTLTVSGTVTNAQLETGSVPSSYIPTSGAQVTRAADTLTPIDAPWDDGMTIGLKARVSYADLGAADQAVIASRTVDANNRVRLVLDTDGGGTGSIAAEMVAAGTTDRVVGVSTYTPGVMVPISVAARFTPSLVQVAHDGTAVAADETPTAAPNLTAANLVLTPTVPTIVERLLVYPGDLGEAAIEEMSA